MAATVASTGVLEGAHDFVVHKPTFNDNTSNLNFNIVNEARPRERPGLDKLLGHSMQDAFYNSASRWPPPRCHYDSRLELRTTITDWGTGRSNDISQFLLWMHGPFGVGKSAIAQSCAEALAAEDKLCASLFFSRPNNRNDPNRVFTSVAYQLALKFPSVGDILDHKILKNPTLLAAIRSVQFEELLVKPLRQVMAQDSLVEGWVIILDGLDEVDGIAAQAEIINIIATSIHTRTTPFRWFILSRPEPHIQRTMRTDDVSPLLHHLDLPLSSEDDHEILTFFEKELEKIGKQHSLSSSWCSEASVAILVKLANGLWVYVNTVTRFIGDPNSLGPVAQLDLVLTLAKEARGKLSTNPLAAMDLFYDLIMHQVPAHIIPTIRKILLLNQVVSAYSSKVRPVPELANVLGLSREQFYGSCGFLQSVLDLQDSDEGTVIHFYHASFMEYMEDPGRSGNFCIYGDSLQELYQEIIQRLNHVHACSRGKTPVVTVTFPRSPSNADDAFWGYRGLVSSILGLIIQPNGSVSPSTAIALHSVEFSRFRIFLKQSPFPGYYAYPESLERLREQLPPEFRDKIIRRSSNLLYYLTKPRDKAWDRPFILGLGRNKLVCWRVKGERRYQIIPPGLDYV